MQLTDLLQLCADLQPAYKLLSPNHLPITKIKLGRQKCLLLTQTGKPLTVGKLLQLLTPSQKLEIEVFIQVKNKQQTFYGLQVSLSEQAVILR
ncbi:MAG: hypothetical protein LKG31_00735 [Lactobacillus sp.]|jgi:hypothetical protein|nr:hypothetical protein [Lactobacillus sp.]